MKILLSNDDGVYADGIHFLARSLAEAGHEVLVSAPNRERSASGHSMTMHKLVTLEEIDSKFILGNYKAYACSGMPTDSVSLAYDALGFRPELVISGINRGPNVADDITYSGTVCAAMEGLIFGINSVALSLNVISRNEHEHYETAAEFMQQFIARIKEISSDKPLLFNINVPNLPYKEVKGIRITKQGKRFYEDRVDVIERNGRKYYWIGGKIVDSFEDDTDVTALRDGYVSVTPLKMDMTDYERLEKMKAISH